MALELDDMELGDKELEHMVQEPPMRNQHNQALKQFSQVAIASRRRLNTRIFEGIDIDTVERHQNDNKLSILNIISLTDILQHTDFQLN